MCIVAAPPSHASARRRSLPEPWADDDPRRQDLDRRLEPDHLARRIDRAVAALDFGPFTAAYGRRGSPPYRPDLLLRAVLFERQRGQRSPAQWARDARESEPLRWLLRGQQPSRSRWYAFRDRLGPSLLEWNRQVLRQALQQEQTPARRGSLDGALVAANASRRRLAPEKTLRERTAQLDQAVAADARAEAPPTPPGWMARTPAGRLRRQGRYERAQTRLQELPTRNQQKRASKRRPPEKIVVSLSDPQAALGRDQVQVYRPLYNVQLVADLDSPLLLGYEVFAQPNDAGAPGPMRTRLTELLGRPVETLLADAGYASGAHLAEAAAAGATRYAPWQENDYTARTAKGAKQIPKKEFRWLPLEQTYVCPQGHRLEARGCSRQKRSGTETVAPTPYRCAPEHCRQCPLREWCTPNPKAGRTISRGEHEDGIEALQARRATPEAKERYRLRRQTVELANADRKEHRKFRRFSGRGPERTRIEVGLTVLVHNLLTLLDARPPSKPPGAPAASPAKIRI